jgi:hypothetical protein
MSAFLESINLQRGGRSRDPRDHKARSFTITLIAFLLVGSVFFYLVSWISDYKRAESSEGVQTSAIILLKKLPAVVGNELASILSSKGMEYQSAVRTENKAAGGAVTPAVASLEMPVVIKRSLPSADDGRIRPEASSSEIQAAESRHSKLPPVENREVSAAPEEPDPASLIDYLIRKRRLSL